MEYISLIVSLIGTGVSLIGIGFTVYVYFSHDKKLNEQQKKLNEQQKQLNTIALEKAHQEVIDNKRAKIFLKHENHKLVITNIGKAIARNITLTTNEKNTDPLFRRNPSPSWAELKPGQSLEQTVIITNLTASEVRYDIAWTDDNGEQSDTQTVYYSS